MKLRHLPYILKTIRTNFLSRPEVVLISEPVNWVILEIAREIRNQINEKSVGRVGISFSPYGLRNRIVHCTSVGTLIKNNAILSIHPSNKVILTWYHILDDDPNRHLIPALAKRVYRIHTAAENTKRKLIGFGCPEEKIVVIPEHVDTTHFRPHDESRRREWRKSNDIPNDAFVIGSFQKDGCGWGDGMEPKLEKGPDVFCDVVERVAKKHAVFVLLTGPARGYVKKRLTDAGIPFLHRYLDDFSEIVNYYGALDAYLVGSREEGGPRALLESWACGVPLVSTSVGMVPDLVTHEENCLVAPVDAVDDLVAHIERLIDDAKLRQTLTTNGLQAVQIYQTDRIIPQYDKVLYR